MTLSQRIEAFSSLGDFLGDFSAEGSKGKTIEHQELQKEIENAVHYNGWFTKPHVLFAINQWHQALNTSNLTKWLSKYEVEISSPKTVGLILAGNIPLVGFHDVLCVLLTGHNVLIKQSSSDSKLLPILLKKLVAIAPDFQSHIHFVEDKMKGHDAIIATGSNNTSRYFEYYFKDVPSIIRKNRNSIAILNGDETREQLEALATDIFRYYGLGCRNVSKIYTPKGYDFHKFFEGIFVWKDIVNDNKYANNYDYNKAVYLMSGADMLDNNFLLVKEDKGFSSPIGVLFQESYESLESLEGMIQENREQFQCIVSENLITGSIPFGKTQEPQLWDYADDIDTVNFLLTLS